MINKLLLVLAPHLFIVFQMILLAPGSRLVDTVFVAQRHVTRRDSPHRHCCITWIPRAVCSVLRGRHVDYEYMF